LKIGKERSTIREKPEAPKEKYTSTLNIDMIHLRGKKIKIC